MSSFLSIIKMYSILVPLSILECAILLDSRVTTRIVQKYTLRARPEPSGPVVGLTTVWSSPGFVDT